ncbi:TonB-dependent receptor, partial [Gammaproteobacteria bacterium]|nr:TonB-dependent receptor [Gammaproteobacteria bacterium]
IASNDTTSALRGDAGVSGATVVVTNVSTGITKTTTADANGVFSVGNLKPGGPYKITISKSGYATESLNDVFLTVSETARLNVALVSNADIDEIVVTGTRTASVQTSLAVTAQDIENIPSIERSISDYVKRDSRIFVEGTARNATISVSGTNNRYNNFTVDGVEQNDQLGLNANGFPSVRNPISIETIEQIQVDISPFDVSKGNFTGASINAVTKSGTNQFKGAYYNYSTDEDNVGNLNGEKAGQFSDETTGFVIGGPIIKDKLFFFVSQEEFTSVSPSEPYTYKVATQALVDEIAAQTKALYNYDPGSTTFQAPPEMADKELLKLDWYINDNHRLEYVYSFSDDNAIRPYNYDIRFSSHYYNFPATTEKNTYAYYGDISDNLYVQAKYSEVDHAGDQDALGGEDFPEVRIKISAADGSFNGSTQENIFLGPDKYRSANEVFAFDEIMNLKAVYTMGDHEITVGYDSIDKRLGNLFISRENGAYQFEGVQNYYDGIPSYFRFNKSATGDPYYAMAGFSGTFETFYIQDKYYVSDILTLNYGLRYDSFEMDTGPAYNEYGSGLLGFRNDTPASTSIVQPRFGFQLDATNLDMFSNNRIVSAEIRGGYGLFAGRVPNVWLASPFANSGVVQYGSRTGEFAEGTPECTTGAEITCFKAPETIYQDFPYSDYASTSPAQAIDPNYDTPSTWKLNLELLLTTANGYDLKLAYNRDDAKDGVGFSDASATVEQVGKTGVVVYDSERAYYITNGPGASSDSFTISVDKDFDNGVSVFASYTGLDAENAWNGTSSQLSSNLEYNPRVDLMNVGVGKTPWAIENRLVAGLNYTANWFDNAPTKFSLFYKVYSGKRFSYGFDGLQDGYDDGNTLLYIPTVGDPNVVYSGVTEGEVLTAVSGLGAAGSHLDANSGTLPYTRQLDLRIAQEIPLPSLRLRASSGDRNIGVGSDNHKVLVYFDLLNVMNFINEDKGHSYYQDQGMRRVLNSDGLDSD